MDLSCLSKKSLNYTIHDYSSFSPGYEPEKILFNNPDDPESRWSSGSDSDPQYITLKLEKPAFAKKITFGKFHKSHVCNVRKFRVYGGLFDDKLTCLLQGGLHDDENPETFDLNHMIHGKPFPIQFLKIVPFKTWGTSHNFSLWHVAIRGSDNPQNVQAQLNWFPICQEKEVIRMCLKHLRDHNYMTAYQALRKETTVNLEAPFITQLFNTLVLEGNFELAENKMVAALEEGYLHDHCERRREYTATWSAITPRKTTPSMRGGHQMCLDPIDQIIYLFGGWNSQQDLNDLWSYDINKGLWTCISRDTLRDGGPSGRSCFKMCLDYKRKELFVFGRYVDGPSRMPGNLQSDFYMYHIGSNKWTLLLEDTSVRGGPSLVFDHQMVMDVENRILYTFGGRVIGQRREVEGSRRNPVMEMNPPVYQGLYAYYVATNSWKLLRKDGDPSKPGCIKSRVAHSMLLHPGRQQLFILGGMRGKQYLNDMFCYDISSDILVVIADGSDDASIPLGKFTHKSTLDADSNEIFVLAGLSKEKDQLSSSQHHFWCYSIVRNDWSTVKSSHSSKHLDQPEEPCPRFAHQFVYDDVNQIHYLFGGNPGRNGPIETRLDDFWSLRLSKKNALHYLQLCRFLIRKTHYKELAQSCPLKAMTYMQTNLHSVVDHEDKQQVGELQRLAGELFTISEAKSWQEGEASCGVRPHPTTPMPNSDKLLDRHHARCQLFQELMEFFPEDITQPRNSLTKAVECMKNS